MDVFSGLIEFVRTVEHLSFVRASESLGMSKSAVSKSVARLEQRLNVKLLNRTTRQISLTEAGKVFYQRCRQILEEIEASTNEVTHLHKVPMGLVRVDSVAPIGQLIIAPALPYFIERYPMVKLDMRLNDRIVDMTKEGVDVVIRLGEPKEPNLVARKVGKTHMITVAAPSYLKRFGQPTHPNELINFNCIKFVMPTGKEEEWRFMIDGVETMTPTTGNIRVNYGETLLSMASNGVGLIQISDFIAARHLISGEVVEVLKKFSISGKAVYVGYRQNHYLSNTVRVFVDFIVELFSSRWHR